MAKSATKIASENDPDFQEKTSLNTVYLLTSGSRPVTVEIIVGAPGQTSTTDVTIEEDIILKGAQGSIDEKEIGTNNTLDAKKMYITTVVTDTSPDTNYTESIIRLRGGIVFKEYHLFKTVPDDGDTAIFTSIIDFFKI